MERMKTYAHFLEALGILEEWDSKSKTENPKLKRLMELYLMILGRYQDMQTEISDLKIAESLMRKKKNEEIINLKKQL